MTSVRHAMSQARCKNSGETSRIIVIFSRSEKIKQVSLLKHDGDIRISSS